MLGKIPPRCEFFTEGFHFIGSHFRCRNLFLHYPNQLKRKWKLASAGRRSLGRRSGVFIGNSEDVNFRSGPQANVSSVKAPAGFPDEITHFSRTPTMRMETPTGFPTGNSFSTFSALHLLRNYNQFLLPSVDTNLAYSYTCSTIGDVLPEDLPRSSTFSLLGPFQPYPHYTFSTSDLKTNKYQAFVAATSTCGRRPRGEKKPIPDDQKDDRYYERRKRNNQAAKKSRDARKLREDQIALRATLLEHENAVLRAQLFTLREETESLRQLILSQKNPSAVSKAESSASEEGCQKTWQHGKALNKF